MSISAFAFASNFDIAAQKAHLRREMKARRALLDESARLRASWLLCETLAGWLQSRPERTVAIFLNRPFEICLDSLARDLMRAGYTVAAPRVELEANRMKFWQLHDLDAVQNGPWNVREPVSSTEVQPELAVVPGLAFDAYGHRLGTGGGWYDGALGAIPLKIGVGFAAQIVPDVPIEGHDIGMNWVASDADLFEARA